MVYAHMISAAGAAGPAFTAGAVPGCGPVGVLRGDPAIPLFGEVGRAPADMPARSVNVPAIAIFRISQQIIRQESFKWYSNVKRTVDFALKCKIGRPFFILYSLPRCRGPPPSEFSKIQIKGGRIMRQRNKEQEEAKSLQNQFTAYLLIAIRRRKKDYLNKQRRLANHEILSSVQEITIPDQSTLDLFEQLPVLMRLENLALLKAIEGLEESERTILFARILEEYSYDELAQRLGLRYKGASAAYYRVLQKLRRSLGGKK